MGIILKIAKSRIYSLSVESSFSIKPFITWEELASPGWILPLTRITYFFCWGPGLVMVSIGQSIPLKELEREEISTWFLLLVFQTLMSFQRSV
jgi:hypothetical protein